jgi:hypothetical protein
MNHTIVRESATGRARALLVRYANRRLPWGTPWWPYAITIAAANLVRQLVVPDIPVAAEITVFVLMMSAAFGAVTLVDAGLRRGTRPGRVQVQPRDEPPPQDERVDEVPPASQWAPWWWYAVVILGVNYLRQLVVPVGTVPEWAVVLIVLATSAVLFVAVTAAYRVSRR